MFRDRKAILLDLEGVLYAGRESLPGARETMEEVRRREIPHLFITNISYMRAGEVAAHMEALGFPASADKIVSALECAGEILRRLYGIGRALVVGGGPLRDVLEEAGFGVAGPGEEEGADLVVVGRDVDLSYRSLSAAARAVAAGARFAALNPDVRAPLEGGGFDLGCGAVVKAIEAAAGKRAAILGKPAPHLFGAALERLGVTSREAVMVGDNLRTDIAGAAALGMGSVWINRWGRLPGDPQVQPDLEVGRVDEILPHLPGG